MQVIQKSAATPEYRRVYFRLTATSDGETPVTGATPTIALRKNGGTSAAGTGTVTELAAGLYYYEAIVGEVDTLGSILLTPSAPGAFEYTYEVLIVDYDPFASPLTGTAIATAVRTELAPELAYLDAPVSDAADALDINGILDTRGLTASAIQLLLLASSLSGKDWTRTGNVITCADGTVFTLTVNNGVIVGFAVTPAP